MTPQVGMLATVRNRRAIVTAVDAFDGAEEGRLHLVRLEYTDTDGTPEETLIWEREVNPDLQEPTALPHVANQPPMPIADFEAMQRATRWTALSPFITPERSEPLQHPPIASPFFGAVQVEDFQLTPLLRALQSQRISLLLADDVGLGKTIEAGLILTELLIRRRIRRVLILSPAALRKQWQQEMKTKFSLPFEVVDREETHQLQKRLGLDANPWRTYSRIVTSYHYLRQPDVLEQFRSACQQPEGSAQLPWDLLIVDEAHNLMPANFGQDSDLSKMLRSISPWFEHKIFLTATPHNGHTRCFSGLLEQLDPVRFSQTSDLSPAQQQRIPEVVIRRLKRDINQQDQQAGRTPRFCDRVTEPVPLYFGREERRLSNAFGEFRKAVKRLIASSPKSEQLAGTFAIEVLNKRLLSCPYTFAQSWYRFQEGVKQAEAAAVSSVQAAQRAVSEDIDDDLETEGRLQHAAKTVGSWLKPLIPHLETEIAQVDQALQQLGLIPEADHLPNPIIDERWEKLLKVIQTNLRSGEQWLREERLVIFTEYKTTLDYLERRLQQQFPEDPSPIKVLYGGLADAEREEIKQAFNDFDDPVRILVATDAASEGLNLQETAHLVLHYDIPWNPARLDQRNGRLDRHGQAQDVIVFHFSSDDDADIRFLARVVEKVNAIREDLGSMGEVFDAAFQRRFSDLQDTDLVVQNMEQAVSARQQKAQVPGEDAVETAEEQETGLKELEEELDLSPETLRDTLEQALGMGMGYPRLEEVDEKGRSRLCSPLPPSWEPLIDDHLRLDSQKLPYLVFDPRHFIENRNGRPVFRSSKDTALLHLGHPLFQAALSRFARARFPGGTDNENVTRWTVRYGEIPDGVDAVLLLTVEELAVNELREPFHHWVRTVRYPIVDGELGAAFPHLPPVRDNPSPQPVKADDIGKAQDLWDEVELDVKNVLNQLGQQLTQQLETELENQRKSAIAQEKERFQKRLTEVKKAMQQTSIRKLEQERDQLLEEMQQLSLFQEETRAQQDRLQNLQEELKRRTNHYEMLLKRLQLERDRVINKMLPKRYRLRSTAQVFPVTVEIRLPQ